MIFRKWIELFLALRHSRQPWDPKNAQLGKDRRIFQRVAVEIPCRMEHPLFGLESSGALVNLSLGGAGVTAAVNWPHGSRVKVLFGECSIEGLIVFRQDRVQNSPSYRYGVKFQSLDLKKLMKLRDVLEKNYAGPLAVL